MKIMPPFALRAVALRAAALAALAPALIAASEPAAPPVAEAVPETPLLPNLDHLIMESLRLGEDGADRMTLPVEIGGDGPWPFIIDTGSQRSVVAMELARHLALPELPPVHIISIAGREQVAAVHLGELKYGSNVVSNMPALSIGRSSLGGAGLIGLDGLKDKRLTLDFRQRKLDVGQSAPARKINRDPNVIVVRARSKLGQLILVNSRVDGRKVNVILDTGAELSIGNMALFDKLKRKRLVVQPETITIRSVTGQPIEAQFAVVSEIQIASVELQNVPMVFLDAAPFAELGLAESPAMLLGMKMLRMFDRVAIDFGSRHIDFELPQSNRDPEVRDALLASL